MFRTAALGVLLLFSVDETAVSAIVGDLLFTIPNPTPANDDKFGEKPIAVVGNNILVGAHLDDTTGTDSGAAYLFNQFGSLVTTFRNPTPANFDLFGRSIAAVGDKVLVGANRDDTGASNAGAAYLFDQSGGLLRTFVNPAPSINDEFGVSVAGVGNNVLVGAPYDNATGTDSGTVYLFDLSGNLLTTFNNPTPASNDLFGMSIAAVDDKVLIGSVRDDDAGTDSGAAYLFDQSGNLLHTFLNPTPGSSWGFGYSVAGVGDKVLIGTNLDDSPFPNDGMAYLFDQSGTLLQTYLNPTPDGGDRFGAGVAAVGDNILIGAYAEETGDHEGGAAYLFDQSGNLLVEIANPTPGLGDGFGLGVAGLGNNIVVGAFQDKSDGNAGGAVYVFQGVPEPSSFVLWSIGVISLACYARNRRKRTA